ncbi:MAG: helix-turn-helix transcriptional regulator [Bdellovibrionia bacterium]
MYSAELLFSKHLRKLRKNSNLTQEKLAEKAGIEYKYVQMLEGKKPPSPTLRTLTKIAKALEMQAWELIRFD